MLHLLNDSWEAAGISHQRICELMADGALVVDRLTVPPDVTVTPRLHWLVDGAADDISVIGSGTTVRNDVHGDHSSVRGWISEGYADKREARSVVLVGEAKGGAWVAVTGFGACRDEDLLRARLHADGAGRALASAAG